MDVPENRMELEQEFWKTLELLVSREWKRTEKDVMDDVQDWVDKIVAKKETVDEDAANLATGNSLGTDNSSSGYESGYGKDVVKFLKNVKLPSIECKFNHPYVRSRLEKLMGSNIVNLTDRNYMQQLQQKILENYTNEMNKRIATREAQEMERVKNLVLTGRIPLNQAPPEMANHPVRLIEIYCQQLIAARRAKIKRQKVAIPSLLYWDDTPDPPSGLSIEKGHVFRNSNERLCHPTGSILNKTDKEDVNRGYMFTNEEMTKRNIEAPLVQQLQECTTVEEMYMLADQIIGILKEFVDEEDAPASPSS